jgi:hypothetical protein
MVCPPSRRNLIQMLAPNHSTLVNDLRMSSPYQSTQVYNQLTILLFLMLACTRKASYLSHRPLVEESIYIILLKKPSFSLDLYSLKYYFRKVGT